MEASVSVAEPVPRGLPGQMENKPLYLHGCNTGHLRPQDRDCVLANSWLMSGREAVPTPRCDVEIRHAAGISRQQIHVLQISRLTASVYKGFFFSPRNPFLRANVD